MNHGRGWAQEQDRTYRDLRYRAIVWGAALTFCIVVWGFVIYGLVRVL